MSGLHQPLSRANTDDHLADLRFDERVTACWAGEDKCSRLGGAYVWSNMGCRCCHKFSNFKRTLREGCECTRMRQY